MDQCSMLFHWFSTTCVVCIIVLLNLTIKDAGLKAIPLLTPPRIDRLPVKSTVNIHCN